MKEVWRTEADIVNCEKCGNEILMSIKTDEEDLREPWKFDIVIKPLQEPKDCCKARIGKGLHDLEHYGHEMAMQMNVTVMLSIKLDQEAYKDAN